MPVTETVLARIHYENFLYSVQMEEARKSRIILSNIIKDGTDDYSAMKYLHCLSDSQREIMLVDLDA